jgi:hypothetical protein
MTGSVNLLVASVRMGEKRNAYRLLVGKTGRKRLLGKLRRRWMDTIKMNLVEIG